MMNYPFQKRSALLLRLPILSGLQELEPAPRRFLFFIVFNVVSWQCLIGPVLVLFARKIDMPPSWVGFLISFTPISTLLVVVTGLMVTRFGAKRLMFSAWMLRNILMCTVFLMPWAMRQWGPKAGWYVLLLSTLAFCLMRAIGAGGWFPWLHEVVPESQRGTYFSTEAGISQLLNIAVFVFQAAVLQGAPGIHRFLLVYAVGVLAGFASLAWMRRIPGGQGMPGPVSLRADVARYRAAWNDRGFVLFMIAASCCFCAMSWLGASSVLYMRDILSVSSRTIMLFTAVGGAGIMLTVRHWARFAEHAGSGRAMALTLTGHCLAAFACLALIPGAPWTRLALGPIVVAASMCGSAFWMTAHRAMLNYVKAHNRVGYTNLWTIGTSIALGLTPIAVGLIIDHFGFAGFRLCFLVSCLAGLFCAVAIRIVVPDGRPLTLPNHPILWLGLPFRVLGQIVKVTAGLHESNR